MNSRLPQTESQWWEDHDDDDDDDFDDDDMEEEEKGSTEIENEKEKKQKGAEYSSSSSLSNVNWIRCSSSFHPLFLPPLEDVGRVEIKANDKDGVQYRGRGGRGWKIYPH